MFATILETLQNVEYNIRKNGDFRVTLARIKLHSVITLLNKGYDLKDEIGPLILKYDSVEDVPEKKDL